MIPIPTLEPFSTIAGLLGFTAREAYGAYRQKREAIQARADQQRREQRRVGLEAIYRDGLLERTLARYYDASRLAEHGFAHYAPHYAGATLATGIVGRPSELRLDRTVADPMRGDGTARLVSATDEGFAMSPVEIGEAIARAHEDGQRISNRRLYRLLGYSFTGGAPSWEFGTQRYIPWRAGIGMLGDELEDQLINYGFEIDRLLDRPWDSLPRRIRELPVPFLTGRPADRLCAGGVIVTTAIRRPDRQAYAIPIRRRSREMATGAGRLGVIPQSMHQHTYDLRGEVDPVRSVFREIFEELFNGRDVEEGDGHFGIDWIFDPVEAAPAMAWLKEGRGYELKLSGFGFDALRGSYEIAYLLRIDDPEFWNRFGSSMKVNWEFDPEVDEPFLFTDDAAQIQRTLTATTWVGSPLFSLVRGLTLLCQDRPGLIVDRGLREELDHDAAGPNS